MMSQKQYKQQVAKAMALLGIAEGILSEVSYDAAQTPVKPNRHCNVEIIRDKTAFLMIEIEHKLLHHKAVPGLVMWDYYKHNELVVRERQKR